MCFSVGFGVTDLDLFLSLGFVACLLDILLFLVGFAL